MTQQPIALRLADALERDPSDITGRKAAAELRRLHEENERLKTEVKTEQALSLRDEPSFGGVIFAIEEAIRNDDCSLQIEVEFNDYEAKRKAAQGIKEQP